MEQIPLIHTERDFLGLVLIVGLTILAYVRTTYPMRWNWVWHGGITTSFPFERDDRFWLNNFNLWMWVVFILSAGSFIYSGLALLPVDPTFESLNDLLLLWLGIASLYGFKFLVIYLISVLFRMPRMINRFVLPRFASIHLAGIVLLLASLLSLYLPGWNIIGLYMGAIISLSLLIFGLLRQVFGLIRGQFRLAWLYIILYICTLEIAPVLFLIELGKNA